MKFQYKQLPKHRIQVAVQKSAATTTDRHPVNNAAEAAPCIPGAKSNPGVKATESNKAVLFPLRVALALYHSRRQRLF